MKDQIILVKVKILSIISSPKWKNAILIKEKKIKKKGHYEKIRLRRNDYIYVNSKTPSNLPNSYVVTEEEATKGK